MYMYTMASSQGDIVARILRITDKTSGRDRLCRQVKSASVNDDVLQVVKFCNTGLFSMGQSSYHGCWSTARSAQS